MKRDRLTETQRKLYDTIKTNDWFKSDDDSIFLRFRNRESQCHKIAEKGYFDQKLVFDPAGVWRSYFIFRKKTLEAPHGKKE
jgi:hypothetical protein